MDLRQIQYFIQLFEDRNITQASRNMFISQQGLSKSIANLEDELGFPLFVRQSKGVIPTERAIYLYNYFERVSKAFSSLQNAVHLIQGDHTIRILAHESYALSQPKDLFIHYQSLHPELNVIYAEAANQDIPDMLASGKGDVAFMIAPVHEDLKIHKIIDEEPLYAVISRDHPLAQNKSLSLHDLRSRQLLYPKAYEKQMGLFFSLFQERGIPYEVAGAVSINEFLPCLYSDQFIGISPKKIYQFYQFPEFVFIPILVDASHSFKIRTLLVTHKTKFITSETKRFIDYQNSLPGRDEREWGQGNQDQP